MQFQYLLPDGYSAEAFDMAAWEHEAVPRMAPGGVARFVIQTPLNGLRQAECVVSWQYQTHDIEEALAGAERRVTQATVRLV